jgi:hypothetical protein
VVWSSPLMELGSQACSLCLRRSSQRSVLRFLLLSLPRLQALRSTSVPAQLSGQDQEAIASELKRTDQGVVTAANLRSIECSNLVRNALDQLRFPALEIAGIPACAELAVALCAEAPRLRELRLLGVLVHIPNAQARCCSPVLLLALLRARSFAVLGAPAH